MTNNVLYWRINGTSLNVYHPPRITTHSIERNGEIIRALTIEAINDYNGTVIDCVIVNLNGSEDFSPQANMTIQGEVLTAANLRL